MKRSTAIACVLAIMSVSVWAQQPVRQSAPAAPAAQKSVQAAKSHKKKAKPAPAPVALPVPAQTMPPVPATLMNSAPVKPNVTLEGGMLTIDAPNSTLSDVLKEVKKVTGAAIEGASPTERVAVKLGPGVPEQVIAALLRGTPYDYVILGALGRRDVVTRVVLTQQAAQTASNTQPPLNGGARQPPGFPPPQPSYQPQGVDDNSMPERTVPDEVSAQPAPEPEPEPQPQAAPAQAQQPDPNQPKTPEQLFRELQQLEQQRQQPR